MNDEFNIEKIINLDEFKVKLEEILKKEKINYKEKDKEEIIEDLKDKIIDLLF